MCELKSNSHNYIERLITNHNKKVKITNIKQNTKEKKINHSYIIWMVLLLLSSFSSCFVIWKYSISEKYTIFFKQKISNIIKNKLVIINFCEISISFWLSSVVTVSTQNEADCYWYELLCDRPGPWGQSAWEWYDRCRHNRTEMRPLSYI